MYIVFRIIEYSKNWALVYVYHIYAKTDRSCFFLFFVGYEK